MRGTVAKRLRRQVVAEMPGEASELRAYVVKRGPAKMRKLRLQRRAARWALRLRGHTPEEAAALVPDPRPNALMAVGAGPRREYRRRKRAYVRDRGRPT